VAPAEELVPRGEVTLETRFHALPEDFSDDDLSSFFDQYHGFWVKERRPLYFLDLAHVDLGLARDDDTYLVRFERWSPHWLNQRGELEIQHGGFDLDVDYSRYRSDELRLYPQGTGGSIPVFSTVYNPDTAPSDPTGEDRRFFSRRTGVGGELRLRLDEEGFENPILTEIRLSSRFEHRRGQIQDSFLLDELKDVGQPSLQTARFRGARREVDQDRFAAGAELVLAPWQRFTGALDVRFETFREQAPVLLVGELFRIDPRIGDPTSNFDPFWAANAELRAFNFVPDTRRLSGSLRASGTLGGASLHAGASATHLEQDGRRAPLQDRLGLPDAESTTYSANGALDVPLGRRFGLNAFGKLVQRRRSLDTETFDLLGKSVFGGDEGQVDPFLERRREITAGLELKARIARSGSVAAGYRLRRIDRDLSFSPHLRSIRPPQSLVGPVSETHTAYLKARGRPLRLLRLSGEIGHEWSPRIGSPRELESASYIDGRGSYTLRRPFTLMLSLFGKARVGKNDDYVLESVLPGGSRSKDFDHKKWSYGLTASALPDAETMLLASFARDVDQQEFAYLRSPFERYSPLFPQFFRDSKPDYESELTTLRLGGTRRVTPALDASLWSSFTWARLSLPDGGTTSALIEDVKRVRSLILSFEGGLEYHLASGTRIRIAYRLDRFQGLRRSSPPLDPDLTVHSLILGITTDLELPWF